MACLRHDRPQIKLAGLPRTNFLISIKRLIKRLKPRPAQTRPPRHARNVPAKCRPAQQASQQVTRRLTLAMGRNWSLSGGGGPSLGSPARRRIAWRVALCVALHVPSQLSRLTSGGDGARRSAGTIEIRRRGLIRRRRECGRWDCGLARIHVESYHGQLGSREAGAGGGGGRARGWRAGGRREGIGCVAGPAGAAAAAGSG